MTAAQASLSEFEQGDEPTEPDLSKLSPAERKAFETVVQGDVGGREFARQTERSWGTVSNLLMRAREKLDVYPEGSA
jgi:DNA-directed RNA polymerase specialized sigma24 family protein